MHIFNMQLFSNCCKLHFDTELIQSIGKLEHTNKLHSPSDRPTLPTIQPTPHLYFFVHSLHECDVLNGNLNIHKLIVALENLTRHQKFNLLSIDHLNIEK